MERRPRRGGVSKPREHHPGRLQPSPMRRCETTRKASGSPPPTEPARAARQHARSASLSARRSRAAPRVNRSSAARALLRSERSRQPMFAPGPATQRLRPLDERKIWNALPCSTSKCRDLRMAAQQRPSASRAAVRRRLPVDRSARLRCSGSCDPEQRWSSSPSCSGNAGRTAAIAPWRAAAPRPSRRRRHRRGASTRLPRRGAARTAIAATARRSKTSRGPADIRACAAKRRGR